MSKKIVGGFRKETGRYRWTRRGMVKLPDLLRPIRVKRLPKERVRPGSDPKDKGPESRLGVKAVEKARRRVEADFAPTPPPKAEKPATRQMRPSWRGKYDDLTNPPKE